MLYLDGNPVPNSTVTTVGTTLWPAGSNQNVILGNDLISANDRTFNGTMDEVGISHTARSADWIKASYTNENNPTAFETQPSRRSSRVPSTATKD